MRSLLPLALPVPILAVLGLGMAELAHTPAVLELFGELGVAELNEVIEEPEPVTVIVVGSDHGVATVRDALPRDEILHEGPGVVAVPGGRIVVARVELAGAALNELGWIDRPLEILGSDSWHPGPRTTKPADPVTHPDDGGPSLVELARKHTLTPTEAIRALRMLR